MKKLIILVIGLVLLGGFIPSKVYGMNNNDCGGWFQPSCPIDSYRKEVEQTEANQKKVIDAVPAPQLDTSQERINIKRRLERFNVENKISYIYLVSYGKVMAFYTVKGKISSVNSYMTPMERLVDNKGEPCSKWISGSSVPCYTVEAPDLDGSYGSNGDAIFFFTTEDIYVEWRGEYMLADQPLKLSTQPELVREIK